MSLLLKELDFVGGAFCFCFFLWVFLFFFVVFVVFVFIIHIAIIMMNVLAISRLKIKPKGIITTSITPYYTLNFVILSSKIDASATYCISAKSSCFLSPFTSGSFAFTWNPVIVRPGRSLLRETGNSSVEDLCIQ